MLWIRAHLSDWLYIMCMSDQVAEVIKEALRAGTGIIENCTAIDM